MLKAIMLRHRIDLKRGELTKLQAQREEMKTREAELEQAVAETATDEEQDVVEAKIDEFAAERDALEKQIADLEKEISDREAELAQAEAEQDTEPAKAQEHKSEERKVEIPMMETRDRVAQLVEREDVKNYLNEVRSAIKEKRALTNVGLTIPEAMLGLIKENIVGYSKLYSRVDARRINGTGRMLIMGTVPEAIWTDCCANLNELSLGFNDLEMDCFKVGGYFAVCNANLEDSDVALASELLSALGQAIGLALDKAILYGRNAASTAKMPQGIVSRLAQESAPTGYPATARPWADLHTSNMITISAANSTGTKLLTSLISAVGAAKGKYSRAGLTWAMNETTYTKIMAELVNVTAAGAFVSGLGATMPVVGGAIVVLPFMADNQIVAGYFDEYVLAERAGQTFATSEHVRFLADQTVLKGTARYDGAPAIAEGFVAIGIAGTAPSATMTFASDTAN